MGTSASFRAPAVPRWQAFTAALQAYCDPQTRMPLERVQSEMFNAGWEWEQELAAPAVAAYAVALVDAHETLPERLAASDRPERALQAAVTEARAASREEPASAAAAIADRAFLAVLTRVAGAGESLTQATAQEAAERFASGRGTRQAFLADYVGELLGQYARHVTAREAGRLTEHEETGAAATRRLARALAAGAALLGREGVPPVADADALRAGWQPLIRDAFARGRRLPERRG